MTRFTPAALRLYLVADPDYCQDDVTARVQAAINNGVTCVQLRWKSATDRQIVDLGSRLRESCNARSVPFIVNDRLDIALVTGAQGVHLGVDDMSIVDTRRICGPEFVIGYSPASDDDMMRSATAGATYLGIGPIFGTQTKLDAGDQLGVAEFRRRRDLTSLPVVAIGGIQATNAPSAMEAGANGVAVVSAILGHNYPGLAAREIRAAIDGHS